MSNTAMTMRQPATRWQDASPIGNGIIGAMMYGQISNETIMLNHDALYYPTQLGVLHVSCLAPGV